MSKAIKAKSNDDLKVLLTCTKLVSPVGDLEIDSDMRLTLFNALKPIITRKYRELIKANMVANGANPLMVIVEEIAEMAADKHYKYGAEEAKNASLTKSKKRDTLADGNGT